MSSVYDTRVLTIRSAIFIPRDAYTNLDGVNWQLERMGNLVIRFWIGSAGMVLPGSHVLAEIARVLSSNRMQKLSVRMERSRILHCVQSEVYSFLKSNNTIRERAIYSRFFEHFFSERA